MCRNNILAGHYQPSSKKADNKSAKVSGNSAFKWKLVLEFHFAAYLLIIYFLSLKLN